MSIKFQLEDIRRRVLESRVLQNERLENEKKLGHQTAQQVEILLGRIHNALALNDDSLSLTSSLFGDTHLLNNVVNVLNENGLVAVSCMPLEDGYPSIIVSKLEETVMKQYFFFISMKLDEFRRLLDAARKAEEAEREAEDDELARVEYKERKNGAEVLNQIRRREVDEIERVKGRMTVCNNIITVIILVAILWIDCKIGENINREYLYFTSCCLIALLFATLLYRTQSIKPPIFR